MKGLIDENVLVERQVPVEQAGAYRRVLVCVAENGEGNSLAENPYSRDAESFRVRALVLFLLHGAHL
jgi:hypothetical protein